MMDFENKKITKETYRKELFDVIGGCGIQYERYRAYSQE